MVRIAKRKLTPRKPAAKAGRRPLEPMAYTIPEFAEVHGFSVDHYFNEARHGRGPRIMKVGARTLISAEAAAEWRRAREEPRKIPETESEPHTALGCSRGPNAAAG